MANLPRLAVITTLFVDVAFLLICLKEIACILVQ